MLHQLPNMCACHTSSSKQFRWWLYKHGYHHGQDGNKYSWTIPTFCSKCGYPAQRLIEGVLIVCVPFTRWNIGIDSVYCVDSELQRWDLLFAMSIIFSMNGWIVEWLSSWPNLCYNYDKIILTCNGNGIINNWCTRVLYTLCWGDRAMPGQPINCPTSQKLLASIDTEALYLWCKRCNTHHAVSKQQVLQMWGIQLPKQQTAVKA